METIIKSIANLKLLLLSWTLGGEEGGIYSTIKENIFPTCLHHNSL